MRKVYLPVYLIEWSDIRPYAIKTAHGLKVGAHYAGIGLRYLAVGLGVLFLFLWKALKWLGKWLFIGIVKFFKGLWQIITGTFSMANPKEDEDEDEDNENEDENEDGNGNEEPRNYFDGED